MIVLSPLGGLGVPKGEFTHNRTINLNNNGSYQVNFEWVDSEVAPLAVD